MSPSSSIPQADSLRKVAHSRQSSAATPVQETVSSKQLSPAPSPIEAKPRFHYTCFIRLPFPRGTFEDPIPVEWDTAKDKALWKLISKASNSKDLDWEEISNRFNVSLSFLLQQAAWLYERHFEGMRKQMQKLGVSGTASPVSGDGASGSGIGGVAMQRTGSKGGHLDSAMLTFQADGGKDARVPSALSIRKDSPLPAGEMLSAPGSPRLAHPISRTPSTTTVTTVTQSRMQTSSGRQPFQHAFRGSGSSQKRPAAPVRPVETSQDDDEYVLGHDDHPASDSEEEPSAMARSQAIRRTVSSRRSNKPPKSPDEVEDGDEDSSGGYLPFAGVSKTAKDDPTATLKTSTKRQTAVAHQSTTRKPDPKADTGDSSASSASSAQPPASHDSNPGQRPGPLSPRQRAQLTNLSPRSRGNGSDGSPSMGSSFSDLDDASVTKSALEEALLSNMQHGGSSISSRVSSLREALRR